MNLYETILPFILPIVADKADETTPPGSVAEDVKRVGYGLLCMLGTEGVEKLASQHSQIPLKAFQAAHAEAVEEFEQAGIGDVPEKLDGFVTFTV